MLTIALFITVILLSYFIKFFVKKQLGDNLISKEDMSEQEAEQVRCSSSESDNFEKIDSDEVQRETNGENPHFIVGEEPDSPEDDGPAHEGGDSFPNAPPPNIRRVLTPAQQLALAEKRSKLRSDQASEDGEW